MVGAGEAMLAAVLALAALQDDRTRVDPIGDIPVQEPVPSEERALIERERPLQVGVPAVVHVHNEMGRRFKLTEAVVLLDAVEVSRVKAPAGAELQNDFLAFEGPVPPGEHAVSVTLIYEGRNNGVIKYMDNYHFRAETTGAFTVAAGDKRPATLDVTARERKGMNVPFEKKLQLDIAASPGSSASATFRMLGDGR
jgi:hypothetical protein